MLSAMIAGVPEAEGLATGHSHGVVPQLPGRGQEGECRAEGKKGNKHNQHMQEGEPQHFCGRYSLPFAKAKERFGWAD